MANRVPPSQPAQLLGLLWHLPQSAATRPVTTPLPGNEQTRESYPAGWNSGSATFQLCDLGQVTCPSGLHCPSSSVDW